MQAGATADTTADAAGAPADAPADDAAHRPVNAHARGEHNVRGLLGGGLEVVLGVEDVRRIIPEVLRQERVHRCAN